MKRKILSITLAIICVFSMSATAFAGIIVDNPYQQAMLSAEKVIHSVNPAAVLQNDPIELYNVNNEIVALCFQAEPKGYVIIALKDYIALEFSGESDSYYTVDSTAKYYYNGPLSYMELVDNQMVYLPTQTEIGTLIEVRQQLQAQEANGEQIILNNDLLNSLSLISKTRAADTGPVVISGRTVPNYDHNPDERCGAVAAAMFLRYYDNYVNNSYVPSNLESSNGVALINYLDANYIPRVPIYGSWNFKVVNGMQDYLADQGINTSLFSNAATLSNISACVVNKKAYVLFMMSHPKYKSHFVTGYGYQVISNTEYAIVNDGHGATGVSIILGYANTIIHH